MSLSVIADVLDALYDGLIAETTIAAKVAAGQLFVSDGPPLSDWSAPSILVVGSGPVQDDDSQSETTSSWATLGVDGTNADVEDILTVPLGVTTLIGDATQMRAARREAFTIYAAAYAYIRGTTLAIPQVMWCQPTGASIALQQTADGAEILLRFSARIVTRI